MVLKTDVAALRVIPVRDIELVRAAVRALVRLRELAQVGGCDRLAVEHDLNTAPVHRDLDMIPFANGSDGVLLWLHEIVNGARVVVARARRVIDRNLDAVEANVLARTRRE